MGAGERALLEREVPAGAEVVDPRLGGVRLAVGARGLLVEEQDVGPDATRVDAAFLTLGCAIICRRRLKTSFC
ncbi:hypothetical protein [Streptomyces sp. KMM 9044]|uniref:hypothetical protein n=1 Tax=Streptomyces sp. KMM 9044 TaxID=2744474 RepID=UPI002151F245|nr:hypothetical protein [Streptomyces sp. KMM 9044]WAX78125.1 hypothetical protein HUV60_011035 [Streptomyces sp. KMM 9044]